MTMTAIFAALQKICFTEAHQGLRKLKPLSMLGETEQPQIGSECAPIWTDARIVALVSLITNVDMEIFQQHRDVRYGA
jgi:hypothetical protein